MAQPSIQGRFVWQELVNEDPAAVVGFYGKVLGWRAQASPHDAGYTVFSTRSGPLAGATTLKSEARAQGTKPHWLIHLGADDVDATLATAVRLGAKVLLAATDLPEVGRYAVLSDPYGAAFAIYKPSAPHAERPPQAGEHVWLELGTSDLEGAFKFYQAVFGWQELHRMDMGAMGTYLIFGKDGAQRGGMSKHAPQAPGPAWLSYIEVADVEKAVAAATKSGGRLLNGPMPVPGGGSIAQLLDPGGVMFAIHTQGKKVETPAAAPPGASTAAPAKSAAAPAKPAAAKPAAAPAPATPPVVKPAPKPPAAQTPAAPAKPAAAPAKSVAAPAKKKAAPVKAAAKKKAAPKPASAKKAAKKSTKKAAKKAKKKVAKKKVAKKKKAVARKKVAARASLSARKSARPAPKKAKPAMVKKDKKKEKKDKKRRKKEKARRKK